MAASNDASIYSNVNVGFNPINNNSSVYTNTDLSALQLFTGPTQGITKSVYICGVEGGGASGIGVHPLGG